MTANIRGHVELTTRDGRTVRLRPTIERLIELEDTMGMSLIDIVQKFGQKKMSTKDLLEVLWCGAKDSINDKSELGAVIIEVGIGEAMRVAASMLMDVVSGGKGAEAALGKE